MTALPLSTPIADVLRTRIRRGVDLAALVGAAIALVALLWATLRTPTVNNAVVVAIVAATGGCALLGVLGRAPWTPIAYIALAMATNVVTTLLLGPWFGTGALYMLATALAFVFLPSRWSLRIVVLLAGTPLLIGILVALGLVDHDAALALDDRTAWLRATLAAATALVCTAVIVSYIVRHLVAARREIEEARLTERAQREERARLEDEIARARRAELIAQLAAEVGADVGAALGIVHARAFALARELADPLAVECLDDIREAARTAGSTMRSLTVFGPSAVATVAHGSATDAARVLPRLVRRSIPTTIALEVTAADDAWVGIDTGDLTRILSNLVLNARDAIGGKAGTIAVDVRCEAAQVRIVIRDDGSGMPPEVLAKLFRPFFTTKPVGRGTGLGLATTKILVERAGGTIAVVSAPGAGSELTIVLPRVAAGA